MDPKVTAALNEYHRQRDALVAAYPELLDDMPTLQDTLEGLTWAHDVIAQFVRDAREDAAMADALANMMRDMAERQQRLSMRGEKRRSVALAMMQAIDVRKIERPDFTASIRAVPPKVEVTDESALSDAFVKIVRSPDKAAIKEALSRGEDVPGAIMGNGSESITIRSK